MCVYTNTRATPTKSAVNANENVACALAPFGGVNPPAVCEPLPLAGPVAAPDELPCADASRMPTT
jgi:hypothetical protein